MSLNYSNEQVESGGGGAWWSQGGSSEPLHNSTRELALTDSDGRSQVLNCQKKSRVSNRRGNG